MSTVPGGQQRTPEPEQDFCLAVPMAWALSDAECQAEPTAQVGMGHRTLPWEPRWHHLFPSLCLGTNVLQMLASRG